MKITNNMIRDLRSETKSQQDARYQCIKTEVAEMDYIDALKGAYIQVQVAQKSAENALKAVKNALSCRCSDCGERVDCSREGTHLHGQVLGSCCV